MNAHLDALNRAIRTFVQGTALGLLLIKTAVSAGVAYVGRRVAPPPAVLAAVPAGGTPSPKTF